MTEPCRCEPCPTCEGAGEIKCYDPQHMTTESIIKTCPTCQGRGRVMPEQPKCPICNDEGVYPDGHDGSPTPWTGQPCEVCSPPITDAEVEAAAKVIYNGLGNKMNANSNNYKPIARAALEAAQKVREGGKDDE